MQLFNIPIAFYLAFVNLHVLSGNPIPSEILSSEDVDILKVSFNSIKWHIGDTVKEIVTIAIILNTITLYSEGGCKCNCPFSKTNYSPQQVLLRRLEESIHEQPPVSNGRLSAQRDANVPLDGTSLPEEDEYNQPQNVQQPRMSLADLKDFLSARDLKAVRNDSPKRYSACFGRRMDRIGSMTSLGCNTVGRTSKFTK